MSQTRHDPLTPASDFEVPLGIQRAQAAFRKDLPQLLQSKRFRQWVAYYGAEQIGCADNPQKLYAECRRRGIPINEFVVRHVIPELPEDAALAFHDN
jgi:hypothetical protein